MTHWTLNELRAELERFERELRAAGKSEQTTHTYVDRAERFLGYLAVDYTPSGWWGADPIVEDLLDPGRHQGR